VTASTATQANSRRGSACTKAMIICTKKAAICANKLKKSFYLRGWGAAAAERC
jgi:hypothetical protein